MAARCNNFLIKIVAFFIPKIHRIKIFHSYKLKNLQEDSKYEKNIDFGKVVAGSFSRVDGEFKVTGEPG